VPPAAIVAAGRTDAGVHAWGQVAHVDIPQGFDPAKLLTGLNHHLPPSIRVVAAAAAGEGFHARFSATGRHYVYRLWNARQLRPDLAGHAGHAPLPLDHAAMAAALAALAPGERDFTALRDAECQSRTPLCTLFYARWREEGDGLWRLEVGADHFLHHMVRNLMGTLLEVGLGKRAPGDLPALLDSLDRRRAGPTFMPDGLYLARVDYPAA